MTKSKKQVKKEPVAQQDQNVQYGKAYSGEVFKDDIKTYDMVQSLLNPLVKKSFFDYLIIFSLIINVLAYYYLYSNKQLNYLIIPTFVASYFFWRVSYNLGIGIVLYNQSNYNTLTNFCQKHKLFGYTSDDKQATGIQKFILLNFKIKYGNNYHTKNYPVDFNTWLLFRNFVDLILMQDFVNYVLLFVACFIQNSAYTMSYNNEQPILFYSRWFFGVAFILLNLLVKIDAHNVIKDFAWYWGDFFYLKINNEELVFDGIFELFPHPMYSIGYIGYYGFALISNSYLVLIVSCIAHFTQFLFLHYVEDPHINKIYSTDKKADQFLSRSTNGFNIKFKPMILLGNFCALRATDYLVAATNIALFVGINYTVFTSNNTKLSFTLFVIVLILKVGFTLLTSAILHLQSRFKYVTKIYLKYDLDFVDAFNNWCVYYNFQFTLTLNVLISLFLREFITINNLKDLSLKSFVSLFQNNNLFFFQLFVGTFLLFLNIICESSILNTIGIYSWFYGDFWLPNLNNKKLTKTGIYKYLNNPEKFLGICGAWGLAVICFESSYLFILAMVWSLCKISFISFIETPHMIKLYGENQVNYDSGFAKHFKKILPKHLKQSFSNGERPIVTDSSAESSPVESNDEAVSTYDPVSFHSPNPLITISKKDPDYQLELLNVSTSSSDGSSKLSIPVGRPIKFRYKIPKGHDSRDWIGLYKVLNTFSSTSTTMIASNNHWVALDPKSYYNRTFGHLHKQENLELYKERLVLKKQDGYKEGILEFNNDLLYWEPGVYELRYHRSDGHDVILISSSFEIKFDTVKLPTDLTNNDQVSEFEANLFELFSRNNYLTFEHFGKGPGSSLLKADNINTDYVSLIADYVNSYAEEALASSDLKKNLSLKSLNSYNVEEFKKKQFNRLLKRLSYVTKNSIEHSKNDVATNINIVFSNEVLASERTLKNLFDRVIKVQKILDEIAN